MREYDFWDFCAPTYVHEILSIFYLTVLLLMIIHSFYLLVLEAYSITHPAYFDQISLTAESVLANHLPLFAIFLCVLKHILKSSLGNSLSLFGYLRGISLFKYILRDGD